MIDFALVDTATRQRLPLPTNRATNLVAGTGRHGFESLEATIPLDPDQAINLAASGRPLRAELRDGPQVIFEGSVEDIAVDADGVTLVALGDWAQFDAIRHTALWSDTSVQAWRPLTSDDRGGRTPDRYGFDTQNRLWIGLKTNQQYDNANLGSFGYAIPDRSNRSIVGLMCEVRHTLPTATYAVQIARFNGGFGGSRTVVATINGTGAVATTAIYLTFAASDAIEISLLYASGAAVTYGGNDGDHGVRITRLRVVTDTTRAVGGNLGTAVAAPGAVVCSPTAGVTDLYVGQALYIGGANPEIVTVSAVATSTFTATFAFTHLTTDPIRAFVLYADTIVSELVNQVNATNANVLSTNTALRTSPQVDVLQAIYEDQAPSGILDALAARGDRNNQPYEIGVWSDRLVAFRPRGSGARTWYAVPGPLTIQQTRAQLINRAYATYQDAGGATRRTVAETDGASVSRYGQTREAAVEAATTSADLASRVAAITRAGQARIIPRAEVPIRQLTTISGQLVPSHRPRNGDVIVVRTLPPNASPEIDGLRRLRVDQTRYDAIAKTITVIPESPLPNIEYQIARALEE